MDLQAQAELILILCYKKVKNVFDCCRFQREKMGKHLKGKCFNLRMDDTDTAEADCSKSQSSGLAKIQFWEIRFELSLWLRLGNYLVPVKFEQILIIVDSAAY